MLPRVHHPRPRSQCRNQNQLRNYSWQSAIRVQDLWLWFFSWSTTIAHFLYLLSLHFLSVCFLTLHPLHVGQKSDQNLHSDMPSYMKSWLMIISKSLDYNVGTKIDFLLINLTEKTRLKVSIDKCDMILGVQKSKLFFRVSKNSKKIFWLFKNSKIFLWLSKNSKIIF